MSLFGVSGYINTANSNKPVIKVDDLEMPKEAEEGNQEEKI